MTSRLRSLSRTLVAATAAAAPVVALAPSAQAAPSAPLPRQPLAPLPTTPLATTPAPALPLPTVETNTTVTQYVTATAGANVRSGPGTGYRIVGGRAYAAKVTGTWENGWLKIGTGQYISGSILGSSNPGGTTPTDPPSTGTVTQYVTATAGANVRSGPGTGYRIVGGRAYAAKVTGTWENGWLKIGTGQYISGSILGADNPAGGGSTPAPQDPPSTGTVTQYVTATAGANVRSGPGTGYRIVGGRAYAAKVTGTWENGWLKIGTGQYISGSILGASNPGGGTPAPPEETSVRRWVDVSVANVRSGPSTSYGVVGTKSFGTQVTGVVTSNGWLKISDREFMSPGVLSTTDPGGSRDDERPPAPPSDISAVRQGILDTAAGYVGRPYVLYSEPDATFDCSSYTWWVYKLNGIDIPRTVRDQKAFVTRVTDPRPGDLIFYNDFYHVGIYAGPGMTYEALNPTAGVRYGPLVNTNVWYGRVSALD